VSTSSTGSPHSAHPSQRSQDRSVRGKGTSGRHQICATVPIAAVRAALTDLGEATPDQIARRFARAQGRLVQPLLESLAALGQARIVDGAWFAA
jgi:hypothetical protein